MIKRCLTFCFILTLINNTIYAGSNIDSLKLELEASKESLHKFKILSKLAHIYRYKDIDISNQYAQSMLDLTIGKPLSKNLYSAYKVLGVNANILGDYHKAIKYYMEGLKISKILNNDTMVGSSHNDIAICYSDLLNSEKALKNYKKALKSFKKAKYQKGAYYVLHNMSDLYFNLGEFDLAKELMDSSLVRGLRKNNYYVIPNALFSIAEIYRVQKKYDESMEFNLKSLSYLKKTDYDMLTPSVYVSIGQIYFEKALWDSSKYYFNKAIEIYENRGIKGDLTKVLIELGKLNIKLKVFKKAKQYLRRAISISKEIDRVDLESEAHKSLSYSLEKDEEYYWAKHHYKEFIRLKDTLFERKNKLMIIDMALTYDSRLKEKELSLLKKEKDINKLQKLFILALTIILFVIAFWVYRGIILKRKAKEIELAGVKQQRKAVELENLHSKINPQFLYSTLNNIAILIYDNAQKAEKTIISLSEFFRYTINVRNKKYSTIKEASYIIQKYLEIEKIRFEERLNFKINVEEDVLEYYIPRGILQKLVENAIKKGVERVKKGIIEVFIKKEGESILLKVSNNGPELSENQIMGFALRNIYDNLNMLFEDAYSVEFENDKLKSIILRLNKLIKHEPKI